MKSYYQLNTLLFISCFFVAHPSIAQEIAKKYAWQQDDSELINNLSDKYLFEPVPVTSFYTQNHVSLKTQTPRVTRQTPSKKTKINETVRKKKSEIEDFLKQHYTNASLDIFDRKSAIDTLRGWHPSKFILMLDDPQLDKFIENRLLKKDSKTLHALAALIGKSALKLAEKKEVPEKLIDKLETKALEIIAQINTLPHINQLIKINIAEHLTWMKLYKPHLYLEYQAMCLPQKPIPYVPLNWMPSNNPLRSLEPQKTAQSASTPAAQSPSVKSVTSLPAVSQPTPITINESSKNIESETSQEEIERLSRLLVRQFKTRQYLESLKTAWTVTKKAKSESIEFQAAKDHIKKMSGKNDYNSLIMMAALEKDKPDQAITYFMQAQAQRSGLIYEHSKIDSPKNTLIFLTGSPLLISFEETDFVTETRQFLDSLAKNNNKRAVQALALFHYKNAAANPKNQLISLHHAKKYADLLDPAKDTLDPAFDLDRFYNDYYQQLYKFACDENNYAINGSVPLTNIFLCTSHLAKAALELEKLGKKNEYSRQYAKRANASFNRNMQIIHTAFGEVIKQRIELAKKDQSHVANLTIMLVNGISGMPLSIEERTQITDFLKSVPNCSDPVATSLRNKTFENSHYAHAAAHSDQIAAADEYFRMLFAIDCGNYPQAMSHAKAATKASSDFASLFLKSILMRSGLIFKTDAQKLISIKGNLADHMSKCPTQKAVFLHSDAIAELEQMRTRKFLPAYPLLIDYNCTLNKPESGNTLVDLLEEAAAAGPTIQTLKRAEIISYPTWQTLIDYCTMNEKTMDPVYTYIRLLLEGIITSSDQTEVTEYNQGILYAIVYLTDDLKDRKLESAFHLITSQKARLVEKLERILASKQNVNNLQRKEVHQSILNLYYLFNPVAKSGVFSELDQLFSSFVDLDVLSPKAAKKNNKINAISATKKDQTQTNSLTNTRYENYYTSDRCTMRDRIHDFRIKKDFSGYKKLYEANQFAITQTTAQSPDPILRIDNLVTRMGHEYMLAQAESQNSLNPLDLPAVNSLIQQAITIHPFYSYHAIACELINDDVWPKDLKKGTEFMHKAIVNGEKNLSKLSSNDILCLNDARKQLKTLTMTQGYQQAINSTPGEVKSGK